MHMIGIMSLCIIYVLYAIMNKFAMVVLHCGPMKKKKKKKKKGKDKVSSYSFLCPTMPSGDKVSMLTHIYPYKPLRKIEVTICNHQADSPFYVWANV